MEKFFLVFVLPITSFEHAATDPLHSAHAPVLGERKCTTTGEHSPSLPLACLVKTLCKHDVVRYGGKNPASSAQGIDRSRMCKVAGCFKIVLRKVSKHYRTPSANAASYPSPKLWVTPPETHMTPPSLINGTIRRATRYP